MSSERKKRNKSTKDFWRACGFLWPYRGRIAVSVGCALVAGLAFTSGLSTMLPLINVLIKGDSVQSWMGRQVVEHRLDVRLLQDDPRRVKVISVAPPHTWLDTMFGPPSRNAMKAGVPEDAELVMPGTGLEVNPEREKKDARKLLAALSDPGRTSAEVATKAGGKYEVELTPLPWYFRLGSGIVGLLPTDPVKTIAAVFGILASLAIFGNFMKFWQEYLADKAAILAVNDIRRKLYDHVLHIPLGFFGAKGTSDVTSRLVQDTNGLMNGFQAVLGPAIQEPINATFTLILALCISWRLTLFIIVFAPVLFVLISKFGKKIRRANRKALESSASMLSQLEGTLIGIRVVKSASAEHYERRRYNSIMGRLIAENIRMARLDAMSSPVLESLNLLLAGVVILYASYLVLKTNPPELEASQFIMVMACLVGMADSLRKITKVNNSLQKSNAAAQRIFEAFGVPTERRRPTAKALGGKGTEETLAKLPALTSEIRFEGVSFTYAGATGPAVANLSLAVPKGRSVAVVGRNGSGKTTLLALLPRFYDPQAGRILIDGVDIKTVTLRSLRQQIAIVTQDSVIFPGTILENIAYAQQVDRERAMDAARRAFAHDFILEKPQGYDTVLGEHGAQLSGGQKQRLCIARAIYRKSPILILDEATSQVDAESEHLIQQAIEQVMHERTTFVIAHRFSTILSADVIVVMERGEIVGQGKHAELMGSCAIYRQLYERQMLGGEEQV